VDGGCDDVTLPMGHADNMDSERHRLTGQKVKVSAAGADRDHPEPPGICRYDLNGLGPD
jgi:hypothetical protein